MDDHDTPAHAAPQGADPGPAAAGRRRARRKPALLSVTALVLLAGLAWGAYDWLVLSHYQETDNAYVQGNVVQITPQIGGTVTAIYADDTDRVKRRPAAGAPGWRRRQVALDQAEAALAQAVRQVRTLYANNHSLAAQVRLREADVAKARSQRWRRASTT
jgi:membrane fusion protein (multidrug efflux system)